MGYFTAGVMMLLGVLLIVKYGRELKVCYPAGGMFIVLGIWWVLNTIYLENPIIDGWLGWVVKIATGVMLAALAAYFFIVRKKEVEEFKASKEPKKTSMYEKYDDYDYSASENKEAEGTEDSASK